MDWILSVTTLLVNSGLGWSGGKPWMWCLHALNAVAWIGYSLSIKQYGLLPLSIFTIAVDILSAWRANISFQRTRGRRAQRITVNRMSPKPGLSPGVPTRAAELDRSADRLMVTVEIDYDDYDILRRAGDGNVRMGVRRVLAAVRNIAKRTVRGDPYVSEYANRVLRRYSSAEPVNAVDAGG